MGYVTLSASNAGVLKQASVTQKQRGDGGQECTSCVVTMGL